MFNDFSLLEGMPMYKRVDIGTEGKYEDGVYYPGEMTTSYEKFTADWEPFQRSQENDLLPSGVRSSDVIIIYTEDLSLVLHNDLQGNATKASRIYKKDPNVYPNEPAFVAFDKEPWEPDLGMELLTSAYDGIICIREEKM